MKPAAILLMMILMLPQIGRAELLDDIHSGFRSVSVEMGLSQSTVNAIVQDTYGFLWIGTNDGLNRYDGQSIEVFKYQRRDSTTLPNNIINDIMCLDNGDVLVATNNGFAKYDHARNAFTRLKQIEQDGHYFNLQHVLKFFRKDSDHIWISSDAGIISYNINNQTSELILPREHTGILVTDMAWFNEQVWLSSTSGMYILDGENTVKAGLDDMYITTITSYESELWAGTSGAGLYAIGENQRIRQINWYAEIADDHFGNTITDLKTSSDSLLWISGSHGVAVRHKDEKLEIVRPTQITSVNIPEDHIQSVFIDKAKNLWLGTFQRGALTADLKPGKFQSLITFEDGSVNFGTISAIEEFPQDYFLIGSNRGVFGVDKQNETGNATDLRAHYPELNGAVITDIASDHNADIWFGTASRGLYVYDAEHSLQHHLVHRGETNAQTLSDFEVNTILHTYRYVWIGTEVGLNRYDRETAEITQFYHDAVDPLSLPGNAILTLYKPIDDDFVYVGTNQGFARINENTGEVERILINNQDGQIIEDEIYALYLSDNNYWWLGTQNGLIRYHINTGLADFFEDNTDISNNFVYSIQSDDSDTLWMSTNRGLLRVSYLWEESSGEISARLFDGNDGLLSSEFTKGASYRAADGNFYFGNLQGINYFKPSELKDNPYPPDVVVAGLHVIRGAEQRFYPLTGKDEIRLSHRDNVLNFSFAVLDFTQPNRNRVRYKLQGFDETWNMKYSDSGLSAIYTNLNPGSYYFHVQGSNNDGIWNNEGVRLSVIIVPPFYQSYWFYSLITMLLLSLVYTGAKYRDRKMNRKNEELEKMVKIRTEELQQRELLFRLISEGATELISLTDVNAVLMYASPSFQDVLGFSFDELFGLNIFELIHPDDKEIAKMAFTDIRISGRTQSLEVRIKNRYGKWKYFRANAATVPEEEAKGTSARFVIVAHNIDSHKQSEKALKQAKNQAEEANKAKSAFLAGMSHELRTPLNAILGFAQILMRSKNIPERERSYVETMHSSGNHLLSMINDVLDISKIEAGRMNMIPEEFSLYELLNALKDMFALQAGEKGLDFIVNLDEDIPEYIYADAGKLRQILINLISNGIKYTNKGFVEVGITAKQEAENVDLNISITDSGVGIPESQLQNIFEPFQQITENYSKGTGLGLAIASRLVSILEGELKVKSKQDEGSEFSFSIPAKIVKNPVQAAYKENVTYTGVVGDKKWKALIVDDIDYNVDLLETFLIPLGIHCLRASDGKEAIEMINKEDLDFVLMDLRMPVMDGITAVKKIRENPATKELPVIAVTASGFKGKKEFLMKNGFNAYIRKPFRDEELYVKINRVAGIEFTKTDSGTEQNAQAKETDNRIFLTAIDSLPEHSAVKLKEAIEFNDLEVIANITDEFTEDHIFAYIHKKARNKEYSFFIRLNEIINPVS